MRGGCPGNTRCCLPRWVRPHLVPREQHGDALRQEESSKEVPLLPLPECEDLRVVGFPLDAGVPGATVGIAVPVVFAVRFVVLLVVTREIRSVKPSWQVTKLMLAWGLLRADA